jgi:glycosyltransferase involved in cell wall biosynthesis
MPASKDKHPEPRVTVIIATAGSASRAASFIESIESLEQQRPYPPRILIVFNGPNVATELVAQAREKRLVDVELIEEAGLPNALNHGRRCVTTQYFGFLDDDDIYLPGALEARCRVLDENPSVDVVTTNGYVSSGTETRKLLPADIDVQESPLTELFKQNWLASCGGLFRTATVDERYFPTYSKYFEWTMTAFLLARDRRSMYIDKPTYVVNETEGSLSASHGYVEAYPGILQKMLEFSLDRSVRALISERLARALHAASENHRERGNRIQAWKYHVRSLSCRGGARYLPYTRKLFV